MTIRWTRDAQKALTPIRGASPATAPALKPLEECRRILGAAWRQAAPALRKGLSHATPAVAAITERALAYGANRWTDNDDAPLDATPDHEEER